jgi:hypothetical protein
MFTVLAALVSAAESSFPVVSLMKALSLLLLFLYASTGARLAMGGREEKFFPRLLFFVEIVVYASAVAYLVLRRPIYGNPNSLGAIMGVVAVPLLFWRLLTTEGRTMHRRAIFHVFIIERQPSVLLSQARAGILAAVFHVALTCSFAALPLADSRHSCIRGHGNPGGWVGLPNNVEHAFVRKGPLWQRLSHTKARGGRIDAIAPGALGCDCLCHPTASLVRERIRHRLNSSDDDVAVGEY